MTNANVAEVAFFLMETFRHATVEKLRLRAEQYHATARAMEEETRRVDVFFARIIGIGRRALGDGASGSTPGPVPALEPASAQVGTDQPWLDAPHSFAYLRAIGDCGEPHASAADAVLCARSRFSRGIPLSAEDQRILTRSRGASPMASAKSRIHLVTHEGASGADGSSGPNGPNGSVARRRVERGPFAADVATQERTSAPIPDGTGGSVLVELPDSDGGVGDNA